MDQYVKYFMGELTLNEFWKIACDDVKFALVNHPDKGENQAFFVKVDFSKQDNTLYFDFPVDCRVFVPAENKVRIIDENTVAIDGIEDFRGQITQTTFLIQFLKNVKNPF